MRDADGTRLDARMARARLCQLLTATDGRDKFAGIAQSIFRLLFGASLLMRPAHAALSRRLMIAVVDARRTFRWVTFVALRSVASVLILRSRPERLCTADRFDHCAILARTAGMGKDWWSWLQQQGVASGSHLPCAKSADWWCAVSLGCSLLAQRSRSKAVDARALLREWMLLVQMMHDLLGRPLHNTTHEAWRQIAVGICGVVTQYQDVRKLLRAAMD